MFEFRARFRATLCSVFGSVFGFMLWAMSLNLYFQQAALADGIVWHTERLTANGVGCAFQGANPNAWVIAAGNDISIVYSALGQEFRARRPGVLVSACNLVIPAELAPGYYVSAVDQKFLFGIAKKKGADVEIVAMSNFARRRPNGDANLGDSRTNMSVARLTFGANEEVTKALEEVSMPPVRVIADGNPRANPDAPFERFCARDRARDLNFQSIMRIRVVKSQADAEVSVAMDGQDLRFNMANSVAPCPSERKPRLGERTSEHDH